MKLKIRLNLLLTLNPAKSRPGGILFFIHMKYYLHDSNSFSDEKVTELYMAFGYEGLGLFYTALEKFAQQEKPVKTAVLKKQLNIGKKLEKCWSFMEEIGLISSNNGESFNKQLLKFSENYKIKKEKSAERLKQWRDNQQVTENETRSELVRNASKVKISKVKESKDIVEEFIIPSVEEVENYFFENGYRKDVAKKAWNYYNNLNWKNSKGKKVLNWKNTVMNNWFTEENKIKTVVNHLYSPVVN
jgi:hypothetical protein